MRRRPPTLVLGIDDAPFERTHRGDVPLVGTVCARTRLDGVLRSAARRDGVNAAAKIAAMLAASPFDEAVRLVMLQGIAVAGFNVVDLDELADRVARPVLVVARRAPDLDAIRRALLERVPGGRAKWRRIVRAGPMEPLEGVLVQRRGLDLEEAAAVLRATTLPRHRIPEPLRMAHLIAGAFVRGRSRGGA